MLLKDGGVQLGTAGTVVFEGATADAFETTLTVTDPTADRTVTIQNATHTLVGRDTTDTLTNKTIAAASNTISLTTDSVDAITEIASALKSGADGTLVTGTSGTSGNLPQWNGDGDIVDSGVAASDVVTGFTLDTEVASTSGTTVDFTSIPSTVKQINVMFDGVSTDGTEELILQIGDSGGLEASGYLSVVSRVEGASQTAESETAGFKLTAATAATDVISGALILTLEDATNNVWCLSGNLAETGTPTIYCCAGRKALSGTLDRLTITSLNTPDDFDAGGVNISYI